MTIEESWREQLGNAQRLGRRFPKAMGSVRSALGGTLESGASKLSPNQLQATTSALGTILRAVERLCANGDTPLVIGPTTLEGPPEAAAFKAFGAIREGATGLQQSIDALRLLLWPAKVAIEPMGKAIWQWAR